MVTKEEYFVISELGAMIGSMRLCEQMQKLMLKNKITCMDDLHSYIDNHVLHNSVRQLELKIELKKINLL